MMDTRKPKLLALLGLIILVVGVALNISSDSVSQEDQLACEAIVKEQHGGHPELMDKCTEPGMVAMMRASEQNLSAQEAAQNISAANQSSLGGGLLAKFLLGLGLALFLVGLWGIKKAKG